MTPAERLKDCDRLAATARRYFDRSGRTEFPTVRRLSRTLRWSFDRIMQAVQDDPDRLFVTVHNTEPEPPIGDHYVEFY